VERAPKGVPIIQWEKDGAEDGGLVKIDLLGNRSLGVIRDAMATCVPTAWRFNESRWEPEDDPGHPAGCGPRRHHGLLLHRKPGHAAVAAKIGRGFRTPGDPQQHHPPGRQ
jgi:error-prone DNA polymerase